MRVASRRVASSHLELERRVSKRRAEADGDAARVDGVHRDPPERVEPEDDDHDVFQVPTYRLRQRAVQRRVQEHRVVERERERARRDDDSLEGELAQPSKRPHRRELARGHRRRQHRRRGHDAVAPHHPERVQPAALPVPGDAREVHRGRGVVREDARVA
eukprot:30524-Pelagococcus_subviridis.AAC.1